MFMEFPGDRACEVLDRQYMLGDSLLVAPVFNESGEVEYYVPDGRWVNLLNGEVMSGGSWRKETFDYYGLPVLVRQNSVLAVGSCDNRTDYDYCDGVSFWLSVFEDGGVGETSVTDLEGKIVMNVKAVREGDVIRLYVEGGNGNFHYKVLGEQEVKVVLIES
jgi:alpha-D-xyloside xylohydrolase